MEGVLFFKIAMLYNLGESFSDIDGSFNSKFMIIQSALNYYNDLSFLNKFFGIGFDDFEGLAGIFAHNIIVTIIYEVGWYGGGVFFY